MKKLRIVVVHNSYQHRGGEDAVVEDEIAMLRANGHEVRSYQRTNDEIADMSTVSAARQSLWSSRTSAQLATLVQQFAPDVIHAHNTWPLVSPSLYWAAARLRVPVVQTLHNFRLMCLSGLYLREGKVCEDCAGRLPWRGVVRKCYRGSTGASGVLAGMLVLHRALGTWQHKVARYIALNNFCRDKFIAGGLPAERIAVKPNFVDFAAPPEQQRDGLLFVGRLSQEKGIDVLTAAARLVPGCAVRVAGSGPQAGLLEGVPGMTALGALDGATVRSEMGRAQALVLPSIWYENFPRTLVEAYGCALPVIASRIGALAELVKEGETGLLFHAGDSADLADKLRWAAAHPQEMARMGRNARALYEDQFTADRNHQQLVAIYQAAIDTTRDRA